MIADKQTHKHTRRHAHHNTPIPCRGRSSEHTDINGGEMRIQQEQNLTGRRSCR